VLPRRLPKGPSLYRFILSIDESPITAYLGEAETLSRRMAHHRTPGPTQQANIRLNWLLQGHLRRERYTSIPPSALSCAVVTATG
jgi:hypothetical protein